MVLIKSQKIPLKKEKYINALLYFIAHCGNEKLGITKLNKLFIILILFHIETEKKA